MRHTLLLIILLAAAQLCGVTRHALLIGLSVYEDASWSRIHGASDVMLMKRLAQDAGFTDIRTLTDTKATKQGIVNALERLTLRCHRGDVVFIHYSGHGQMMTDLDGDEAVRHKGKRHAMWDESLVPYDARLLYSPDDRGEKHFSDDELAFYLTAIRKRVGSEGRIYVVLDACHSGDGTCGEADEAVRGVDTEFVIPKGSKAATPAVTGMEENWLTVSACRPYQLCFEQKKPQAGKLTLALFQIGPQMFSLPADTLQKRLQEYIDAHPGRLPQNPMVKGKP